MVANGAYIKIGGGGMLGQFCLNKARAIWALIITLGSGVYNEHGFILHL